MNNPHPQILTPYMISPSPITLHLPPSPDVSSLSPFLRTTSPVACTCRSSLCRQAPKRLRQSSGALSAAPAPPARNTSTWCRGFWWTASSTIATVSSERSLSTHFSCCTSSLPLLKAYSLPLGMAAKQFKNLIKQDPNYRVKLWQRILCTIGWWIQICVWVRRLALFELDAFYLFV